MFIDETPFGVKYSIAIIGRFIFGIGESALSNINDVSIAQWFYMQEYAFAEGTFITVGRFGTVLNNYITNAMSSQIGFASLIGLGFLTVSVISGFIFVKFEKHAIEIEQLSS